MTELNNNVYTVRNPSASNFQLYNTDGTTAIDGTSGHTSYTSGGAAAHGVVIVSKCTRYFCCWRNNNRWYIK